MTIAPEAMHWVLQSIGVMVGAILIAVINKKLKFDPDIGGYTPNIKNKASYPKFYVHGVSAALLMCGLLKIGLPAIIALFTLFIMGWIYEKGQGFVNWLDLVAEIIGGLVGLFVMLVL